MKMKWFEVNWSSSRSESAGNVVHFQAFRDAEEDQFTSNPEDMKMASPRVVSVFDREGSPLRTRFLTGLRHFSCHFVFIYESTP